MISFSNQSRFEDLSTGTSGCWAPLTPPTPPTPHFISITRPKQKSVSSFALWLRGWLFVLQISLAPQTDLQLLHKEAVRESVFSWSPIRTVRTYYLKNAHGDILVVLSNSCFPRCEIVCNTTLSGAIRSFNTIG